MAKETVTQDSPVLAGVDFASLLGDPSTNPEPASALEQALAPVTPQEAGVSTVAEAAFSFRSLLTPEQKGQLVKAAPGVAAKMVADHNTIIAFGEPVLTKLNSQSAELLRVQRDIKVPEAETIVNDLLREIDGYEAKFRNAKMEGAMDKLKGFLKGAKYTVKAMVRESKPIADKIDLAEVSLKTMELRLADNVSRGQQLHKTTVAALEDVVSVLAALEEILEILKADFTEVDDLVKANEARASSEGLFSVTYRGQEMAFNELKEVHADLAGAVGEVEKTWSDWRQQFFLGYAQAPSTRNIILVSATMQRRCQVFRTMGLPSARSALAMWQQAALAKEGAEMGTAVQEGTNKLIQNAFGATADAVEEVAKAAQTPMVTEETVFAVIDSVRRQCQGLVEADKWGRNLRARNLKAMEAGEKQIDSDFTTSRRQLVENAMADSATGSAAPLPEADILGQLGVK